jgi:hypothetical protein
LFFLAGTFAGEILSLWIGPSYFAGYALTLVFALTWALNVWGGSNILMITATDQQKRLIVPYFFEAVLNLSASIFLARYAGLGLLGIALGTLIGQAAIAVYFVPRIVRNSLQIPVYRLGWSAMWPICLAGLALSGLKALLFTNVTNPYILVAASGLLIAFYGLLLWHLAFTSLERAQVKNYAERLARKLMNPKTLSEIWSSS